MNYSTLRYRGTYSQAPNHYLRVEDSSDTLFELKLFVQGEYLFILPESNNPELYKHIEGTRFKFLPTGEFVDLLDHHYGSSKHFIADDSRVVLDFANMTLEVEIGQDKSISIHALSVPGSKIPADDPNPFSQINSWKKDILGYLLHGCHLEHAVLPISGESLYVLFPSVSKSDLSLQFISYVEHSLQLTTKCFTQSAYTLVGISKNSSKILANFEECYTYIKDIYKL